jgi:hypothetical protein
MFSKQRESGKDVRHDFDRTAQPVRDLYPRAWGNARSPAESTKRQLTIRACPKSSANPDSESGSNWPFLDNVGDKGCDKGPESALLRQALLASLLPVQCETSMMAQRLRYAH